MILIHIPFIRDTTIVVVGCSQR
ncbi:hypothetical protein VTJ04DRAFT_5940 [Mycothermus thermophilus]